MRLYRGLKNPYRPILVPTGRLSSGTDFTDCPATALLYAQGSRGVLLVVDIDAEDEAPRPPRVTRELWLNVTASRFMIWGRFDDCISATLLAKDLRAQLRQARLRNAPQTRKANALRAFIDDELRIRSLRPQLVQRSEINARVSSHE